MDRRESQSSQPQGYSAVRVNLTRVGRIVHNSPNCRRVFAQLMLDRSLVKRFIAVKGVPPHFAYVSKRVPSYGGPTFVSSLSYVLCFAQGAQTLQLSPLFRQDAQISELIN